VVLETLLFVGLMELLLLLLAPPAGFAALLSA
jgi:hypothetical protein